MEPTKAPWAHMQRDTASLASKEGGSLPALETASVKRTTGAAARPLQVPIVAEPRFPPTILDEGDEKPHAFEASRKRITSVDALRAFLVSREASQFVSFILALNEAMKGRSLLEKCNVSAAVQSLISMLDEIERWIDEIPPVTHAVRYGNPAYRTWFARLRARGPHLLAQILPVQFQNTEVLSELLPYLLDSFGNETRIDYGTGHETTFVCLLFCLARLGIVGEEDGFAIVARAFDRYLRLMRRLQATYWLEPAGSHGAWGLDDYQFLPFFWGSAQLIDHPYLKPDAIFSDQVLQAHADQYLYLAAVGFVRRVKTGPLRETSPMLTDIAGVATWSKINKGMRKMYEAEVLGRLPIMQHFLFGSLLRFNPH